MQALLRLAILASLGAPTAFSWVLSTRPAVSSTSSHGLKRRIRQHQLVASAAQDEGAPGSRHQEDAPAEASPVGYLDFDDEEGAIIDSVYRHTGKFYQQPGDWKYFHTHFIG